MATTVNLTQWCPIVHQNWSRKARNIQWDCRLKGTRVKVDAINRAESKDTSPCLCDDDEEHQIMLIDNNGT